MNPNKGLIIVRVHHLLSSDRAENSIMQTITIAVSAILIAAGLITAPGLINNARDNNARGDLANIAYAQEVLMADDGTYSDKVNKSDADVDGWYLGSQPNIKYNLSDSVDSSALVCNDPDWAYLLKSKSASDATFFRSSAGAKTSSVVDSLVIPDCIVTHPDYADFISGSAAPVVEALSFLASENLGKVALSVASSRILPTNAPADDPATITLVDGALPTGMSLVTNAITGKPTAIGEFEFTLNATNSAASIDKDFVIKVDHSDVEGWDGSLANIPGGMRQLYTSLAVDADGSSVVIAVGTKVYVSHNFGQSWMDHPTALNNGGDKIVDISDDGNTIVAAGANPNGTNYSYRYTYSTVNGGTTWGGGIDQGSILASVKMTPKCRAADVSSAGNIMAFGCADMLMISMKGTGTQLKRSLGADAVIMEVTSWEPTTTTNGRVVQATLSDGKVYQTTVVSGSWTVPALVTTKADVVRTSTPNGTVFAATSDGSIYKNHTTLVSSNAVSWSYIKAVTNTKLYALASGSLYTSSDAGVTWKKQPAAHSSYGIKFASVAADGTAIVITDGTGVGIMILNSTIDW